MKTRTGNLVILSAICMLSLALPACKNTEPAKSSSSAEQTGKNGDAKDKVEIHTIEMKGAVDGVEGGARLYPEEKASENHLYTPVHDYYNGAYNETVQLIKSFETYQQSSEYSCGPACLVMMLNHYGSVESEDALSKEVDARYYDNVREDGSYGTTTEGMVKALKARNFKVQSSLDTANKDGYSFPDVSDFSGFVKKQLADNNPIAVENVEFGGHWMVIIGYDDMGTETYVDDTLVFADPYDVSDQLQDGYITKNMERYYYEWFDGGVLPEGQRIQQYVTVVGKEEK